MELLPNGQLEKSYGKTVKGYNLITGEERPAKSGKTIESRNPANLDDLVGVFPESDIDDLREAARTAKDAYKKWSGTPAPIRGEVIGRIGTIIEREKEALARLMTREMGKTLKESVGSIQEGIDTARFFQSEGRRLYGETVPSEMRNKECYTYRRPIGVCAMITAGNFPFAVPCWKIIPAILCGNTVVWKPSKDTPTIGYLLGKIFMEAGVPKGVVNIVHGGGATTGEKLLKLIDEGLIQKVSFTGSTAVGRKIGEICGRNLQTPSLELGGKNPMIVMESANFEAALEGALWAAYGTAGQRCTSLGCLILHKPIAKKFTEAFLERAKQIKIGDPSLNNDVLYGPMINERFLKDYVAHLDWGKADGATLAYGKGRITENNKPSNFAGNAAKGLYVWPSLWTGLKTSMKLAQEEIFGPVTGMIEVNNFDEAIEAANANRYGLSSAIYTNIPLEIVRFKNEIQSGMASINNSTTGAEAHLPFGGNKESGNGTRESGIWVIDAYTKYQAVNMDLSGKLQLAQMETEYIATTQKQADFRSIFS